MEKIKVGIIGSLSSTVEKHIEAMKNLGQDFDFCGVCDLEENRLREQAFKYEVPFWTNHKEMLKLSGANLYVVAAPNYLHKKIGEDVAKEKKDALIEAPISLNLKEAGGLINSFEKRKRNLFAMLPLRASPALKTVKHAIDEGKLGKIYGVDVNIFLFRPAEYFKQSKWKGVKKLEGGGLLDQGIDYIDIIQWFFGPLETVFSKVAVLNHKIETEDSVQAILKFKNGAFGALNFNLFSYPQNLECSITIFGSQGTIKIGGEKMQEIVFWDVKNYAMPSFTKPTYNLPTYIYAEIVPVLRGLKKAEIDGREARKSIEIIEAIYKSAKNKKEVKLPL